ncbi:MAG: hypothetical protein SRB2_03592 [Desulfobacteraceae bacterium Eth-SRB2]|nr:MAG: hypothetical protein SRB2_03592 [Desulfobacteraceae bacterium Eth-SRB2]
MKHPVKKKYSITAQRRIILKMINASFIQAQKLGAHPLTKGCNCIVCVNKRKRIIKGPTTDWKFKL